MSHPSRPPPMVWGSLPDLVGPRHAYRVRRLASWLEQAVPRGHILDAGCGAGRLTELLARRGYQVTAVDASADFVAHVRARLQRSGLDRHVEVRQADLESPDLPTRVFDGVVSGDVLEHVQDDAAAVRALAAALKPGGPLIASVPAGAAAYDWLDAWAGHQRRYDERGLRAVMDQAGLRVERVVRWGFPVMALYERFVQRPGLARAGRPGAEQSWLARAARSGVATAALGALFRVDELFDGSPWGTGYLVRSRKP